MKPEDVGFAKSSLVLGKHSGRHAVRHRLEELGYRMEAGELERLFEEFKRLADRRKEIHDADLKTLAATVLHVRQAEVGT
jgi:2-isopropylmalate synthase